MTRRPDPRWNRDESRNARIRELRDQREAPIRRRRSFQPVVLLAWLAGVMVLVGVLLFVGFSALSPALMDWVEEHPGSIGNGIVQDFVQWYQPEALADEPVSEDNGRVSIFVEGGTTDGEIGALLFSEGLIKSELAFQWAVIQAGREGTLQAGAYDLSPSMTPSQIVAALRQEAGEEITITLIEGWRLEQIIGYLGSTRLTMNLEEFAGLAMDPPADLLGSYDFLADLPDGRSLEGYLYPDTYRVDANATAREVIDLLLGTFDARLSPEIREQIAGQQLNGGPMSIDEAVTIASIVEREAVLDTERALIAGVYVNRLQTSGWRLDADPTIQYALGTLANEGKPMGGWGSLEWWPPLMQRAIDIVLPDVLIGYHTYLSDGLPPSPIAAPRLASLAAVAAPDTASGYFFFVAACPDGVRDGSHYFATTLGQHEANIAKANAECPAL
jgi:UPF0755 protein